jgi:broad specificity phosphatase PhoE
MQIILCRHGETEWSLSGKHTSYTDIHLTQKGEEQAQQLKEKLADYIFDVVYTSPLKRAKKTCELAGFQHAKIEPLAVEWNYGSYEGLTTPEIWQTRPGWNVFENGAPLGENPDQVALRADTLIKKWTQDQKSVLLFSHAHFLRALATRWIELPPACGRNLGLHCATISVLGFERSQRIIESWNN